MIDMPFILSIYFILFVTLNDKSYIPPVVSPNFFWTKFPCCLGSFSKGHVRVGQCASVPSVWLHVSLQWCREKCLWLKDRRDEHIQKDHFTSINMHRDIWNKAPSFYFHDEFSYHPVTYWPYSFTSILASSSGLLFAKKGVVVKKRW